MELESEKQGCEDTYETCRHGVKSESQMHRLHDKSKISLDHEKPAELPNDKPCYFPYSPVYVDGFFLSRETSRPTASPEFSGTMRNPEFSAVWTDETPVQHPPPRPRGNPWRKMKKITRKYDNDMCEGWTDDADTMLVFAGLFSAAATAFCIEAFQRLAADPSEETNALLYHISRQLANSSLPSAVDPSTNTSIHVPESCRVQVNILYLISLTIALSVAFLCILCKQWIREYQRDISVSHRDAVRLRQLRFEDLTAWHVPEILASLPVLLQIALLFFFSGLLLQLWHSIHVIAAVLSGVVGTTLFFVLFTTIAPAHFTKSTSKSASSSLQLCAFRSPQALLYYRLVSSIRQYWDEGAMFSWQDLDLSRLRKEFQHCHGGVTSVHRSLLWIRKYLGDKAYVRGLLFWCMQEQYLDSKMDSSNLAAHVMEAETKTQAYSNLLLCEDTNSCGEEQEQNSMLLRVELLLKDRFASWPNLYAHEAVLRAGYETCVGLLHIAHADDVNASPVIQDEGLAEQIAILLQWMLAAERRLSPVGTLTSLDMAITVASIFILPSNSVKAHRIWDAALRT